MKDQNVIARETYAHKNGLMYDIIWAYDDDCRSPLEVHECGVVEHMDWDPTDEGALEEYLDQYDVGLEEEARLRLMRVLRSPSARHGREGIYYDYLATLHKVHTEWGFKDHDDAVQVVEGDFEWLKGWYNDDWHWISVSAAPIDPDTDRVMEEHRQWINGYESNILKPKHDQWRIEAMDEVVEEVEWTRHQVEDPDQMDLDFS